MKSLLSCTVWSALITAAMAGEVPAALANQVLLARSLFGEASNPAYRGQLMVISPGVSVDPPPDPVGFKSVANVIVTIESGTCFELIHESLKAIESSQWKVEEFRGYPRAYWRIVGPWEYTVLGLLVDEVSNAVCCGGVWYRVDRSLIRKLTWEFTELALQKLPRGSGREHKGQPEAPEPRRR
jgi:hypothetical protein